jgi:uncharacterized protein (TIGR00251 family)
VTTPVGRGALLSVKVVPGASRDRVAGRHGDGLRVQVSAPPERGRATAAAVAVVAAALGVDPRLVEVVSGHASPRKVFRVVGATEEALRRFLEGLG